MIGVGWGLGVPQECVSKYVSGARRWGTPVQRKVGGNGVSSSVCNPTCPVRPQLAEKHGGVFTVWVGPTALVALSGFQAVKEALISNSEQFSGRPLTPLFQDLFSERGKSTSAPQ